MDDDELVSRFEALIIFSAWSSESSLSALSRLPVMSVGALLFESFSGCTMDADFFTNPSSVRHESGVRIPTDNQLDATNERTEERRLP